MNAPFYKFGLFGGDASLLVAIFIGIGFGFFLERAGFGSARKLAAQFYFTDLRVFKVMFVAIITAMLGMFWLSWLGLLDYSKVTIPSTYLVPQIVGGLVFGIGFVMGGYCPGTSCVAAATGRLDGVVHLFGMISGILIFGELYSFIDGFYTSTPMGRFSLPDLLQLPFGLTVFLIVFLALAGFAAAERLEKRFAPSEERS
jgi:uncharacterized membrane protein YedE/YeeE